MYNAILYPTNGSDGAEAALENVRDLARTYDATVHILYVADTKYAGYGLGANPNGTKRTAMVSSAGGAGSAMVADQADAMEFRAKKVQYGVDIVDEVAERLYDIDTERIVRGGEAYEVIRAYTERRDIDIIVLGTGRKSGLSQYFHRGVAEKLIQNAEVPVMSVRKEDLLKRP